MVPYGTIIFPTCWGMLGVKPIFRHAKDREGLPVYHVYHFQDPANQGSVLEIGMPPMPVAAVALVITRLMAGSVFSMRHLPDVQDVLLSLFIV